MLNEPDVSVCVTTYNHAPFIHRCLSSVLAQSFRGSIELLVGDDGSTDGTREIVAEIAARDGRLRPVFHPENLGPTGNLEALVVLARGRCIAHLDGDDAWFPTKLSRQCDVLDIHPDVVAVYANATIVTPDDVPLGLFNYGVRFRIDLTELLRRGNFLNHSSLIYRSSARGAVLGMSRPWIDYRLAVRMASLGAIAYVDEPLVVHRWRTPGSMITTMPRAVIDGHLDAYDEALGAGACAKAVRAAAGHAWGKVFVSSLFACDFGELRHFSERLAETPGLRAGFTWRVRQALLAPWRAWRSRLARKNGVYFL